MVEEYNNVDFDDELYYVHSPCPTKTISEIHNCLTSVENATSSTDVPIREEIAARLCSHEHFHVIDLTNIAYALHKFSRNQKLVYLQAVLFCLSSPVGENNNLLKTEVTPTRRKRKIVQVKNIRSNTTTCFSLLGKGICLQSFAGVFGFPNLQYIDMLGKLQIQKYRYCTKMIRNWVGKESGVCEESSQNVF